MQNFTAAAAVEAINFERISLSSINSLRVVFQSCGGVLTNSCLEGRKRQRFNSNDTLHNALENGPVVMEVFWSTWDGQLRSGALRLATAPFLRGFTAWNQILKADILTSSLKTFCCCVLALLRTIKQDMALSSPVHFYTVKHIVTLIIEKKHWTNLVNKNKLLSQKGCLWNQQTPEEKHAKPHCYVHSLFI